MVIFLGGPPRVGKSILAKRLNKELNISYTSTDALRYGAKQLKQIPPTDPLFILDRLEEWEKRDEFYTKYSSEKIISFQNKESEEVAKIVKGFIESTAYRKQDIILEGVALLPRFFETNFLKEFDISFFCVGNTNFEAFYTYSWEHRGTGDWLSETNQDVFEKIIKYCSDFSKTFKDDAEKYNIPYFEIQSEKFEEDIEKITEDITQKVS